MPKSPTARAAACLHALSPADLAVVLRHCGDWRHALAHIVLGNMSAEAYGRRYRCHGPASLTIALDRLERAWRYAPAAA